MSYLPRYLDTLERERGWQLADKTVVDFGSRAPRGGFVAAYGAAGVDVSVEEAEMVSAIASSMGRSSR